MLEHELYFGDGIENEKPQRWVSYRKFGSLKKALGGVSTGKFSFNTGKDHGDIEVRRNNPIRERPDVYAEVLGSGKYVTALLAFAGKANGRDPTPLPITFAYEDVEAFMKRANPDYPPDMMSGSKFPPVSPPHFRILAAQGAPDIQITYTSPDRDGEPGRLAVVKSSKRTDMIGLITMQRDIICEANPFIRPADVAGLYGADSMGSLQDAWNTAMEQSKPRAAAEAILGLL